MGNLRDELINKGLVSSNKAKQMAHAERARKKKIGQKKVAEERLAQQDSAVDKDRARRDQDRKRESMRQDAADAKASRAALIQLIGDHAQRDGVRGPRKFHFVTRAKRIPYIEVSDQVARGLERGEMAICELPDSKPETFLLLPAETARRVQEIAPEYVLFFQP